MNNLHILLFLHLIYLHISQIYWGREIAQWIAFLSVKPAVQVRTRHDPLVSERWNSIYVIMHVKDPQLSVIRVGHHVPLAGFCLSLYGLHVLNRDVYMIRNKKISHYSLRQLAYQMDRVWHTEGFFFYLPPFLTFVFLSPPLTFKFLIVFSRSSAPPRVILNGTAVVKICTFYL